MTDLVPATLPELNEQQQLFVQHRLNGLGARASARAAGYADTYASELDALPQVRVALAQGRQKLSARLEITRDDVLEGLMSAVRGASDATELVMAWREIGRIIGAYEPAKVEVKVAVEELTPKRLAAMTDAELAKHANLEHILDAEFEIEPEVERGDAP